MKITVEIELKKAKGPRVDADEVREFLINEIQAIGTVWIDDTGYEIENVEIK